MEIDEILHHIGEFGPAQRRIYFSLCTVGLVAAFHAMGYMFWGARPNHWCAVPSYVARHPLLANLTADELWNATIPWEWEERNAKKRRRSQCRMHDFEAVLGNWSHIVWMETDVTSLTDYLRNISPIVECSKWDFDQTTYQSTISTKWSLVCNRKWLTSTSQAIYFGGRILGTIICGHLADRFGRRITLLASTLWQLLFSVACALTPDIYSFMVLRCCLAISEVGLFMSAYIIVMELVGPSWRVFAGTIVMVYWAVGYLLVALAAFFIRDALTLQLTLSVPTILLFSFYWIVPETPRWLLSQGRSNDAIAILKKMAACNKKTFPHDQDISMNASSDDMGMKATVVDLLRTPFIRKASLLLAYVWIANTVVYYGLSLNTSNLVGNEFINFAVAGAVEIPGYLMGWLAQQRFGRRWPQAAAMTVAGVALLVTTLIPKDAELSVVIFAMIGKCSITASFAMVYVYTSEIYPTIIRSMGVGFCMFTSRIVGILAPYSTELEDVHPGLPLILFGFVALAGGFSVLVLPETKGRPLPETIEDGEMLGKEFTVNCCAKCRGHSDISGANAPLEPGSDLQEIQMIVGATELNSKDRLPLSAQCV